MKFDEEFFKLDACKFAPATNTLTLTFWCMDNYSPHIPAHEKAVGKQLTEFLNADAAPDAPCPVNVEFVYKEGFGQRPAFDPGQSKKALADLAILSAVDAEKAALSPKVDKTLKVHGVEYWLGAPVKIRPNKIKYLREGKDEQVTAGTIKFLKKREYKRPDKETGEETTKSYYTFALDDGENTVQCVFFPTEKTRSKFEKLADKTVVCVVGVYQRRGEFVSLRVNGISFCEMG